MAGTDLTMALNQSGDSIFGRCKFRGVNPWNGLVAGSLSGKMVNIAVAAMQGKVLVSTLIIGMISGDSIQGKEWTKSYYEQWHPSQRHVYGNKDKSRRF